MNKPTPEQFLKDVCAHKMTVLQDDGLYRHIKFAIPGDSSHSFSLVTWPGFLTICGDMGTYVFSRTPDMFEFFATPRRHFAPADAPRKDTAPVVNLGYWAEKLVATDTSGQALGAYAYQQELMEQRVKDELEAFLRDRTHLFPEEVEEMRDEVESSVLCELTGDKTLDIKVVEDFSHDIDGDVLKFQDAWEWSVEDYTYHFTWCCYAIAWGIELYEEYKAHAADQYS